MPISRITSITPKGSFPSEHGGPDGKLYSHTITFEDGTTGEANTKTPTPYYRQGEEMAYTIKSTNAYGNKLKIDKLAPGQSSPAPQQPQRANPSHSEPLGTPVPSIQPIRGDTIGMALKLALDLLTKGMDHDEVCQAIIRPAFHYTAYELTSDIIRLGQLVESRGLAPNVKDRANGVVSKRPQAGPGGAVALPAPDEDVPF